MKKLLILTATLLTGGLALPASAQSHYRPASSIQVFISGYLPCGSPIYSKRVRHGNHYRTERLSSHELRRYRDQQRRIAMQRELQRRLERERNSRSRYQRSSRSRRR